MTSFTPFRLIAVPLLAAVMTCAFAPAVQAQAYIAPFVGYDFGGDSGCAEVADCEEKNLNAGVAFGRMGNIMGTELEFGYAKDFFGDAPGFSSSVLTVMGNLMAVPNLWPVRPYGLVGLGLIKTNVELESASLLESDNNHFGWNIGAGLMVLVGDHFGVRGDIRYFHAFQDLELLGFEVDGTKLDFGRASAGLVFKF